LEGARFAQIPDLAEIDDPMARANAELGGIRTILYIALRKDATLLGRIDAARLEVRPFSEKEIALLESFAAQAVIAIENARLLGELRDRSADLARSVDELTATSDVLKTISRSTVDLQTVLNTLVETAARLCHADHAFMSRRRGDLYHVVASVGASEELNEYLRHNPFAAGRSTTTARAVAEARTIQVADVLADPEYASLEGPRVGGFRTVLAVPLLRGDTLVGVFSLNRIRVNPFTEKEIGLITAFADQAVIAIENARLLGELRERTGQLEAQSREVATLNRQLEQRVADQVGEIERMSRLRRFLPPQVADLIVASGMEQQLESHRREIAALFCDLRGFTGFSESSDPEDVMALLREYHGAIGQIIIKYSGTLERYAGDGVMVVFNDPVPVENPALQAVLMALDMRAAIGALIDKWQRLGHDLGFGIGIAHGFATLGTIGFEGRFDYAAIGTVSNVASRLCDEAKPGQILISPRVLMAVDKAVTAEPVGEFSLKGIRRPMVAYNVLATSVSELK
jgi:adenylate cyclase